MKKLILAIISLLFIASSCIPQMTSVIPPVSETPLPVPTLTPTSLPDISPVEWASNEDGSVIPQRMYPLVGAIDKKHRRTLDLDYAGLKIAVVLGEGVDLQDPRFITNHREVRSFYATELNKQGALKQQLGQIKVLLDGQGITQDSIVIIEGHNWPSDLSVPPLDGSISQVVVFGKYERAEIKARYVLENTVLRQFTKEEEHRLLPKITISGKDFVRNDTGEITRLAGFSITTPFHHSSVSMEQAFDYIDEAKNQNGNIVLLHYSTDKINPQNISDLIQIIKYAEEKAIYIDLIPVGTKTGHYQENEPLPGQEVIDAIEYLAQELKPYNHVMFDVYNEPNIPNREYPIYNNEWNSYLSTLRSIIDKVRVGARSDSIIFVTGLNWGRDFQNEALVNLYKEYQNIAYRVQDIPTVWPFDDPNAPIVSKRHQWENLLDGNHAIFIGEMGFPGDSVRENSPEEKLYIEEGIDLANLYGYGWSAFHLAPFHWRSTIVIGLKNHEDGTTSYVYKENNGLPFVTELNSNPPYQFDK